jgi:glycolate oxidase iron-sulfur subunit
MSIPLEKPQGRVEARVTYHDPCHLRRGQGVWQQPRALLQMIDGLEFVELPEADWCCGSAGSQLITHYETSLKVLQRKMENLESTQAEYIASGCPGCQMQLNVGAQRRGLEVQVVHPIALLDRTYNKESIVARDVGRVAKHIAKSPKAETQPEAISAGANNLCQLEEGD